MNDAMLQTILLVAIIIVAISLTGVVLLQRSEGGALGMGGGPSGFMTARGAGNLLTRATSILAIAFFVCAISLTIAGNFARGSRSVIDADAVGAIAVGNEQQTAPAEPAAPTPTAPVAPSLDDLEASLPAASAPAPAPAPAQ